MENQNMEWRSANCRQTVVDKINEALLNSNMGSSNKGSEMESHVFQKAQSREEYLGYVAKLIIHVQNTAKNKPNKMANETMPDPINALQNLASQGARNPMQPQMMMGNPMGQAGMNQGSNLLQNLIHQRPGQQQMAAMQAAGRVGPVNQASMAGNMPNTMTGPNMAGAPMAGTSNMNMGMGVNQNVQSPAQQMAGGMGNQMNQIPGNQMSMNAMNVHSPQINPMNNLNVQSPQMNPMPSMNVQSPQMNAMNNMNVQSPMSSMVSMSMNPPTQSQMNQAGVNPNQLNQNQVSQLLNRMNPTTLSSHHAPNTMGPQMTSNQMTNQVINTTPTTASAVSAASQPQMNPNIISNQSLGVAMNQPNVTQSQMIAPGQMNLNQMLNMQHMTRNQSPNMIYQARNAVPNQQFMTKSPSPSVSSPKPATSHQNQMVPSPALGSVASPQIPNLLPQQRNVMAPSPGSVNLNTPGQAAAAASPLNAQEDQLYREKYRQLTKYIEPLKRMIARIGNDDEKLLKMNKLLEILCNPNQRIPLETLLKCEIALEKMDLKSYSFAATTPLSGIKEYHSNNPLLEAVSVNLQSSIGNHTLQRTFRPCIETLFGPDIKNLPPAKQARCNTASDVHSPLTYKEIPHSIQGEIARLDQRFKVTLVPESSLAGSGVVKIVCFLNDKFLSYIPPIQVLIPDDYPARSPQCILNGQDYTTPLCCAIHSALVSRIFKLPKIYSLSQLLEMWEMAVRQACAPESMSQTETGVLLGI